MEPIYVNVATVSASNNDVSIQFQWVAPSLNEKHAVVGQVILREQVVTMSLEMFKSFAVIVDNVNRSITEQPK